MTTIRVGAQMCLGTNVSEFDHACAQSYGHNHVWAQMCLGTNVCGQKRVWAETYVSGQKRVWEETCVGTVM